MRPLALVLVGLLPALALAGCLEDRPRPAAGSPDEEALAFSLRVVETYLASDYGAFRALLAESLYTLEGDGPFTPEEVDAWSEREGRFPNGRDYRDYTMDDYRATYAPEVLTFDAARERHPEFAAVEWTGWTPDGDDRVFLGSTTKEGREPFLWDDLLAFAVTRESGEWRFKAFSG